MSNDIFKLQQLKFYYKLIKGDLPKYFQHFSYIHNFEIHHHYTRETSSIFIPRVNHKCTKTYPAQFDTDNQ